MKRLHTLVIGSGAAGLAAALRLDAAGVKDLAVWTEGLKMGTSINTGSDKQTYYKLGMYGAEPDAPVLMARDLAAGGSMHGDIALAEASLSAAAFAQLVALGVPFPHDRWGQYIGYKTDHDPRRRATSTGPYTSRDMCRAMIAELRRRGIAVEEDRVAVKLLTDDARSRVVGALFLDARSGEPEAVQAENVVFAVGGPGGLYETSVYPPVHTGAIGLALEAGAAACNLAESQFGLASIKFRWNVSGSFMQVLPRFVSTDAAGGDEREFLRPYFETPEAMYDAIFLKGYQWPFAAAHVPGSSLIDIFTYIECVERGRRVWLDFRTDPADFPWERLGAETRDYLTRSGAEGGTPLERLARLNAPAVELYRKHGIRLEAEPLEIAVCAQHNNGGLAGTIHWESVNLRGLFPVGEVNGSHGVTRPGGSALNAGQVGAIRAAECIARRPPEPPFPAADFDRIAADALAELAQETERPAATDWRAERRAFQHRMSACGAFVRSQEAVERALAEAAAQRQKLAADGLGGLAPRDRVEALRNRQLCLAHHCYLTAIAEQVRAVGSRGGSLVLAGAGEGRPIHPKLPAKWRMAPEREAYRREVMQCRVESDGKISVGWEPCRPVPEPDGWFETVWREDRENLIFAEGADA